MFPSISIVILTVYKQVFLYLNFVNHRTKEFFVLTANKPVTGTLMTIGDVTASIATSTYSRILRLEMAGLEKMPLVV